MWLATHYAKLAQAFHQHAQLAIQVATLIYIAILATLIVPVANMVMGRAAILVSTLAILALLILYA